MSSRLDKLITFATQEYTESNITLKMCPRCKMPHSKFDTNCQRCAKKAKRIEQTIQAKEIQERRRSGKSVTKKEHDFLDRHKHLLDREVSKNDLEFLKLAPYELPEELVPIAPSFKNRLQFFLDRMNAEGRQVTTTHAAAKLLEFEEGGFVNKKDFIDFATDRGVLPLMSADWEQLFAAWKTEDILKLFHERQAEKSAKTIIKTQPGKLLTTAQASAALGMAGTRDFIELAKASGIQPVKAFGERAEQLVWHLDVAL